MRGLNFGYLPGCNTVNVDIVAGHLFSRLFSGLKTMKSPSNITSPLCSGQEPTDAHLEGMINEAAGPINFTMFLTMFGEKLNGTDPEETIMNAFQCFDEDSTGRVHEDYLRELLTTMGDR